MKTRLLNFWESLRTSFWFVPALMVCCAVAASFFLIATDRSTELKPHRIFGFFYEVGPEGARMVLSTIATSMITVAGVVFSITIVALTLASSQFGPRMLRNFMKDKGNQTVLGMFISTFIYCLLVLRAVHTSGGEDFVPNLSVTFALILSLTNVGVLIYFIHHISASIQAEQVVASVYHELDAHIDLFFPQTLSDNEDANSEGKNSENNNCDTPNEPPLDISHYHGHTIRSDQSGYLQAIDDATLFDIAKENDLIIRLPYRPGCFVSLGSCLFAIMSKDKGAVDDELQTSISNALILGSHRTPEQDIEFTVNQLVEIAVRALSPGINDPFTALACIDRLGTALCRLSNRAFPSANLYDDEYNLRVITKPITFAGITNAAFDQIRQYGLSSVAVSIRLMETLTSIANQATDKEQYEAIKRQAEMTRRASESSFSEENDIADIKQRYQACMDALSRFENDS
ncbi:DUF2254 domain-containing protein [Alkalimarinus coralli]|uniref:DUF2254 domain-containing protein n=1 Tax=Alkalimarinus coralli TaxID=2935863 RepID=UPI00202ADF46|nr:DUF2254 domain-containing protein [Alkalimarinus coralli]